MQKDDIDYTQFGNPHGEQGKKILTEMNDRHRSLSEWGLSHLATDGCKNILDIGCGGGMLLSILGERFSTAELTGVDISDESIELSATTNADLVKNGRCRLVKASVSKLPFDNGCFDLVTAFETYFFWPDIKNDLKEATRVVSDSGYIVIVSEQYPHPDFKERNDGYAKLFNMKLVDNDVLRRMIESNGFEVSVTELPEKNWVVFVGRRVISCLS